MWCYVLLWAVLLFYELFYYISPTRDVHCAVTTCQTRQHPQHWPYTCRFNCYLLGVRIGWRHPAIHPPINRFARLTSLVIWVAWHPTTSFQRPTVLEMVPPSEIHIHVNVYLSCEYIRQELLSESDSLFTKFNNKEIVSNVFLTLTLPLNIALLSTLHQTTNQYLGTHTQFNYL